jgi:hypothetical protein
MGEVFKPTSRRSFVARAAAALSMPALVGRSAPADEPAAAKSTGQSISVAVVTGGHAYDVINFHRLFRSLAGVEAVIQHMDDFASSPPQVRESYDAVLFYTMLMQGPANEGQPWYAGRPKDALERLGSTPQGIFVLHHALLAYPQWPVWSEIVGIADRKFGYHIGQKLHVNVVDAQHPITRGMHDWDMIDETYTMAKPGGESKILLTVEHPKSMKAIGWTRQFKKSRVFCLESGHDNQTWANAGFREVLRRGLLWCAGKA